MSKWLSAFGPDWQVPAGVLELVPVDLSWPNDAMPSFTRREWEREDDEPRYQVWVDHPDDDRREFPGGPRFAVQFHPEGGEPFDILRTDDEAELRAGLRELIEREA